MAGKGSPTGRSQPPVGFPHDVVTEILSIIPARAFVRFRCVSKTFNSFLTDSRLFQKLGIHPSRNPGDQTLLFHCNTNDDRHYSSLNLDKIDLDQHISFDTALFERVFHDLPYLYDRVVSCNGIVCDFSSSYYNGGINLLNPSTGELRKVEEVGWNYSREVDFFGFGYDCSKQDFKIVAGSWGELEQRDQKIFKAKVYSLKGERNWRATNPDSSAKFKPTGAAVYLCGTLHWKALDSSRGRYLYRSNNRFGNFNGKVDKPYCYRHRDISESGIESHIVSFNLSKEKFREFALPAYYKHKSMINIAGITTLRGRLCVSVNYIWTKTTDVWVMEKYGNPKSWIKLLTISRHYNSDLRSSLSPICYTKNGSIVFQKSDNKGLDVYDPTNKSWSVRRFPRNLVPKLVWSLSNKDTGVSLKELLGDQSDEE